MSSVGRRSALGVERMFKLDGETRPSSVRELRPHFPGSPGGPEGIWAPRHVIPRRMVFCLSLFRSPTPSTPRRAAASLTTRPNELVFGFMRIVCEIRPRSFS